MVKMRSLYEAAAKRVFGEPQYAQDANPNLVIQEALVFRNPKNFFEGGGELGLQTLREQKNNVLDMEGSAIDKTKAAIELIEELLHGGTGAYPPVSPTNYEDVMMLNERLYQLRQFETHLLSQQDESPSKSAVERTVDGPDIQNARKRIETAENTRSEAEPTDWEILSNIIAHENEILVKEGPAKVNRILTPTIETLTRKFGEQKTVTLIDNELQRLKDEVAKAGLTIDDYVGRTKKVTLSMTKNKKRLFVHLTALQQGCLQN